MANDDWMQALAGVLQGISSVYVPRKQAEYENALIMQRQKAQQDTEMGQFQNKLGMEEASKIRIENAKPRAQYQAIDYETGDPIGQPGLARPVPISRNQMDPISRAEGLVQVKKQAMMPKAITSMNAFNDSADNTIRQIDELIADPNLSRGLGLTGKVESKIKGSPAYDIRAKIDSVKSAASLDQLTSLRAASPTGGALGNVSDTEGRRLESSRANIDPDQSPAAVKKALKDLRNFYLQSKQRVNEGFTMDFGDLPAKTNRPQLNPPAIGGGKPQRTADDILNKYLGAK